MLIDPFPFIIINLAAQPLTLKFPRSAFLLMIDGILADVDQDGVIFQVDGEDKPHTIQDALSVLRQIIKGGSHEMIADLRQSAALSAILQVQGAERRGAAAVTTYRTMAEYEEALPGLKADYRRKLN